MSMTERLNETHERLVEAVHTVVSGEDWRAMLEVARRFHRYSANNVLLILAQRPDATRVAGYTTWRHLGRQVRRGEHGIAILAPMVSRVRPVDEHDEAEHPSLTKVLRGFRVVHVFDLAQTEGEPLPDVAPEILCAAAPAAAFDAIAELLRADDYQLLRADCSPANGKTHFLSRTVVVRPDLPPAQALKTLVHELAHTRLHDGSEYGAGCRGVAEVEAESVAYLVCGSLGVETRAYSFPYVVHWADGNVELVQATAARVIGCARQILERLGERVSEAEVVGVT